MGFSRENFARITHEYEIRREAATERAEARRREITSAIPEIGEIDRQLNSLGLGFFGAAKDGECAVKALRDKITSLRKKRGELLAANGYPQNYDSPEYRCAKCSDTGWVGIDMCECFRQALRVAGYESCGIGRLAAECTFDSFDVSYYSDTPGASENNALVAGYLKKYASEFGTDSASVLLMGGPGVGKTHLSVAVAGAVVDGGHDTVFVTAGDMMSDFQYEQFRRGYDTATASKTERYFGCDLLVIDDLGTEFGSDFSASCVYNVINTRLVRGLPTFITTNLTNESIKKKYDLRVFSRLFNEYRVIRLTGGDVRGKKHGRQ